MPVIRYDRFGCVGPGSEQKYASQMVNASASA